MSRKLIFGAPPRHNYEGSPPPYSGFDLSGVEGPKGEKLADIRKNVTENVKNNKFVAKRGGWKRLAIAAAVLTCIIVGLVVGLVVGLYNPHSSKYGPLAEILAGKLTIIQHGWQLKQFSRGCNRRCIRDSLWTRKPSFEYNLPSRLI